MKLIDALPKTEEGDILLSPGKKVAQEPKDAPVRAEWFTSHFGNLAVADVPLSDPQFEQLRGIDWYWKANADRWRSEGLI